MNKLSRHVRYVVIPQNILFCLGLVYLVKFQLWSMLLWSYAAWVVLGVFGVSTVYHKVYAHRAFKMKRALLPLQWLLTFGAMLTGQGSPISYAVIHRVYHHPNSDLNGKDPHSPKLNSFWHAYYGWHFKTLNFNLRGVRDLTSDSFLTWCHRNYYPFFIISHLVIGLLSFKFLIFCVVFPSVMHVHEMNILNSFSHSRWFGYRNFHGTDESVNHWLFGILSWGTGFHNNHHAHPQRWHNQVRWFEFDPFRWIVPLLRQAEGERGAAPGLTPAAAATLLPSEFSSANRLR